MYHKNLHVSVEKTQKLTLQDLEEIFPMNYLFYVLLLSFLMKHSIISCTINVMLHQVTGGLIQANLHVQKSLPPAKKRIFGQINISKCASEYLFSFLKFTLRCIRMLWTQRKDSLWPEQWLTSIDIMHGVCTWASMIQGLTLSFNVCECLQRWMYVFATSSHCWGT